MPFRSVQGVQGDSGSISTTLSLVDQIGFNRVQLDWSKVIPSCIHVDLTPVQLGFSRMEFSSNQSDQIN